ncbi:hypothetical protein CNYM01_06434 [Colletotrichum nymphaeae SA-01]|uniref:Uncharacterized protein n=1 Tax=Colletotrichum nymphaeae SA-01 TaxID=1460502 RepID=A0A135SBW2_9PEZI|nr:hypothetical protein CNYM01_06434 [Colletotrichum nymphaeae SA-01]
MTQPAGRSPPLTIQCTYIESQTPSSFPYYAVRTHLSYGAHTLTGTPYAHTKKDGTVRTAPGQPRLGRLPPALAARIPPINIPSSTLARNPRSRPFGAKYTHTHAHMPNRSWSELLVGPLRTLGRLAPLRILELRFDFILQDRSSITHVFSRYCNPLGLLGP